MEKIKERILDVYNNGLKEGLMDVNLGTCTIDFAYVPAGSDRASKVEEDRVLAIEVNPFSPSENVGNNPASLGIFDWGNHLDQRIITGETVGLPVIRVRETVKSDLKSVLQNETRDFIFGTHASRKALKDYLLPSKGFGKGGK